MRSRVWLMSASLPLSGPSGNGRGLAHPLSNQSLFLLVPEAAAGRGDSSCLIFWVDVSFKRAEFPRDACLFSPPSLGWGVPGSTDSEAGRRCDSCSLQPGGSELEPAP